MFSWRFKIEISIIPPQMDLSEKFWKTMKMLGLGFDNPDPSIRWIMIEFWHFDKSDSFLAPETWRCCEEPERVWQHCWDKKSRYNDSSNKTTTTDNSSPHQRQSHGPFYPHLQILIDLITCLPLFTQIFSSFFTSCMSDTKGCALTDSAAEPPLEAAADAAAEVVTRSW